MGEQGNKTLDEQAFGFNMSDVNIVPTDYGAAMVHKNASRKGPAPFEVKAAHTTLEANGDISIHGRVVGRTDEEIEARTQFGGSGGMGTFGIGIAHNPHSRTAYTIERSDKNDDGLAKRVHKGPNPYAGGLVYGFGNEVDFAPQHQERAKELIRSLGKKQMAREVASARRAEVKKAKEILGRAGVKIPKQSK